MTFEQAVSEDLGFDEVQSELFKRISSSTSKATEVLKNKLVTSGDYNMASLSTVDTDKDLRTYILSNQINKDGIKDKPTAYQTLNSLTLPGNSQMFEVDKDQLEFAKTEVGKYQDPDLAKQLQKELGVTEDGILGKQSITALANYKTIHGDYPQITQNISKISGRVFVSGKYQLIPSTLQEAVKAGFVKESDKYDAQTQEKLGDYLLTKKRPAIGNFVNGKGSIDSALLSLAQEWASMPSPVDRTLKNGTVIKAGDSYYGGANKSGTSLNKVKKVLLEAQKNKSLDGIKDLIAQHESKGDYNAYNQGTANNKIIAGKGKQDLSRFSIKEILNASKNKHN